MSNSGVDTLRTPLPPPRDIDPGNRRLAAAIYVCVAVHIIGSVFGYLEARTYVDATAAWLTNPSPATEFNRSAAYDARSLGAVLSGGGFLVAGVLSTIWLYRGVTGRWVDHPRIRYSPQEAVWSWLIPFINWVRPFRIVSDLSDAAAIRAGQRVGQHTRLLRWWWGVWLLDIAALTWQGKVGANAETYAGTGNPQQNTAINLFHYSATALLLATIINAVAATLFVLVVRRVSNQLAAAAKATVRRTPTGEPEVSAGR